MYKSKKTDMSLYQVSKQMGSFEVHWPAGNKEISSTPQNPVNSTAALEYVKANYID